MIKEEGCIVFENEILDFNEFTFKLNDIEVNACKCDYFAIYYQFSIPFRYLEGIFDNKEDCNKIIRLWENGEIGYENNKLSKYFEFIDKLTMEIEDYICNKLKIYNY